MRLKRTLLLALLGAGYFLALYLLFHPVQVRVWNHFSAVDVFLMACLILPFMILPLLLRPRHRVTRCAWAVCAVMALDLVFFAMAEFGPLGAGHPSLESLASYFLAMARPILVPVALALLGVACVKGEQMVLVATGFPCLAGETLYAAYPTAWWGTG